MADVTIRMRPNGPLVIEGPFKLVDSRGAEFDIPAEQAGRRAVPLRPIFQASVLRRQPQDVRLRFRRSADAAGGGIVSRPEQLVYRAVIELTNRLANESPLGFCDVAIVTTRTNASSRTFAMHGAFVKSRLG